MSGRLVVCPTPIGNLEDITLRVLAALREATVVACEDTRRTRVLLDRYGVKAHLVSYHEHNERERAAELVRRMNDGDTVALVSDAGMPLVSDPGFVLVREAVAAGLAVEVLPGPSAVLTALVASGLPAERWRFAGFLPRKKAERIFHDLLRLNDPHAAASIARADGRFPRHVRGHVKTKYHGAPYANHAPGALPGLAQLAPVADAVDRRQSLVGQLQRRLALPRFGSNAVLVSGRRTRDHRPMIYGGPQTARITLGVPREPAVLTCDGQVTVALEAGSRVAIEVAPVRAELVRFQPEIDFFDLLRSKLRWGLPLIDGD